MVRTDEGPCFNWPPSEVENLSEDEVRLYNDALDVLREKYRDVVNGGSGN